MWKRSQIDRSKKYFLQLCQGADGIRHFVLTEVGDPRRDSGCLLETEVCDNELLWQKDLRGIAQITLLTNGQKFHVDNHGMWLTTDEGQQMKAHDYALGKVQWQGGVMPRFAPK